MKIVMFTNTFTPHVGGVANSVEAFSREFRRTGHRVLVVAPEFPDMPEDEEDVLRVAALQEFNGSDFSFPMPAPRGLRRRLEAFGPEIVHSHHPFLLGDTALRVAAERDLPIVFTHHTLYERYTHYVPGDSPRMKRAAIELAVGYCELASAVIAPSRSIADLLIERGVDTPIEVIPTGVDLERYGSGNGERFRQRAGIPADAFLVGHLGRLAPEKNVPLLAEALSQFLAEHPTAWGVIVGEGPSRAAIESAAEGSGVADRLRLRGRLQLPEVADAYAAMDAFLFASTTETQGMVLTEAMAAGTPVVAIDASGVREVVVDGENGYLLEREDASELAAALARLVEGDPEELPRLRNGALATADEFSLPRTAERTLALYERLLRERPSPLRTESSLWQKARARLAEEWEIARKTMHALGETLRPES